MYATKPMSSKEIALVRSKAPFAGFLGHAVTGYRETGDLVIETDSEIQAIQTADVVFIRRSMNGKYIYRRIVER